MTDANCTYYSGETTDTQADMGGTSTNHLHMYDLDYKNTSNIWNQVDYNLFVNVTTANTPYRASTGFTSPYAWVENWTQR